MLHPSVVRSRIGAQRRAGAARRQRSGLSCSTARGVVARFKVTLAGACQPDTVGLSVSVSPDTHERARLGQGLVLECEIPWLLLMVFT